MKRFLTVCALALLCAVLFAQSREPIKIGVGRDAKWSPDETKVSLIRNDSLYFVDLTPDHKEHFLYFGPILKYYWVDDSTIVTFERSDTGTPEGRLFNKRISLIPMDGMPHVVAEENYTSSTPDTRDLQLLEFPNRKVAYRDKSASTEQPLSVITKHQISDTASATSNLYVGAEPFPWGKVWLYYGSPGSKRQLTISENRYLLPRLSPTLSKFLCFSTKGELVVFDTLGNELYNVGKGDMPCWSRDGMGIVYCVTKEGHYDIEASDIYYFSLETEGKTRLTDTPDVIEYQPSFSPSGNHVLYSDDRNYILYVLELVKGE